LRRAAWHIVAVAVLTTATLAQQSSGADWQEQVRASVRAHQFSAALDIVRHRLREHPGDLQAVVWQARLLSWMGDWKQAEGEYRSELQRDPGNVEALLGLCDVLTWQRRFSDGLPVLMQAERAGASPGETLRRKGALFIALGRTSEAVNAYAALLNIEPADAELRRRLEALRPPRVDMVFGGGLETTPTPYIAQDQSIDLQYRFTPTLRAGGGVSSFQRFGSHGRRFQFEGSWRAATRDWFSATAGASTNHLVVARHDLALSYSHLLYRGSGIVRGLETGAASQFLWYTGSQAKSLRSTATVYFPRDVEFSVAGGASRASVVTGLQWSPTANARLAFPLLRALKADISSGVGTEVYAAADRRLQLNDRSFGAGLRYSLTPRQFLRASTSVELLPQHASRVLAGFSYGISF
jgi:YaiO family outer membrane protein